MSKRDELALKDYLQHMEQAMGRIRRYLVDIDQAAFIANEEKQDRLDGRLIPTTRLQGCDRPQWHSR